MLNNKEIIALTKSLLVNDPNAESYVVGRGITTNQVFGFSPEKIEDAKETIAKCLIEIGLNEKEFIILKDLMRLKEGGFWNYLTCFEDYQALDNLLAVANACGFINNSKGTEMSHVFMLGDINSILISQFRRVFVPNDEDWLKGLRETVIERMYFTVNIDKINEYKGMKK